MRIVTSGSAYIDIDAYAGCIAYAELLKAKGIDAIAYSSAPINESVTKTVLSWGTNLNTKYQPSQNDTFILIDVSDPEYFDPVVDVNKVSEVIDHHVGFEDYWLNKIEDGAKIEFIGAACTLIFELWNRSGLLEKMSEQSARILICGILDNTLNFGAKITNDRDKIAYKALLGIANLPFDWTSQYFKECQENIFDDLESALKNDSKIINFVSYKKPVNFGQLLVWDVNKILNSNLNLISSYLSSIKPDWFLNLINIKDKKSYYITDNVEVQIWLEKLLDIKFIKNIAISDRLWLRKEVIKTDQNK